VYQIEKEEVESFRFDDKYLCFISIASYKAPELDAALTHQIELDPELNLRKEQIERLPLAPDVDTPMWIKWAEGNNMEPEVHPVEARKMDTTEYNKNRKVTDRRIMHFFKSHHPLSDDPNLHVAALLYMSDRNSLFTILNVMDEEYMIKQIASIDHSFVCHNLDPRVDLDWLAMETFTTRTFDNRGLYQGRVYDSNNRLICSFMQDGVLRLVNMSNL
jgi:acyl-CoA thioesterase II